MTKPTPEQIADAESFLAEIALFGLTSWKHADGWIYVGRHTKGLRMVAYAHTRANGSIGGGTMPWAADVEIPTTPLKIMNAIKRNFYGLWHLVPLSPS